MGTYNPACKSTSNLLRGLRGFIGTDIIGVIRAHDPSSRLRVWGLGFRFKV